MVWEIDDLDSKTVNLDLGFLEPTLKGFRSKTFSAPPFVEMGASKEGR